MLQPGLLCQYHSTSKNCWIATRVVAGTEIGSYDLECRLQAAVDSIAPLLGVPVREAWPPGTDVSYFSTSENQWMPAVIVGYNENLSTYDLNIRKQVTVDRIRARLGCAPRVSTNSGGGSSGSCAPKAPQSNAAPKAPPTYIAPIPGVPNGSGLAHPKSGYAPAKPAPCDRDGPQGGGLPQQPSSKVKVSTPRRPSAKVGPRTSESGDPYAEWLSAPLRDFDRGLDNVGDFIKGIGASFELPELPRSVSLDFLELPSVFKNVSSQHLQPCKKEQNTLGQCKQEQPSTSQHKKGQRVQVWSQSEGAWMDAVIHNVYQDGAVGITYLDKNAHKVIPEEALAQWMRAQPYMSVVQKDA